MSTPGLDIYLTGIACDDIPACSCGTEFVVFEPDQYGDTPHTACRECDSEPCRAGGCTARMEWDEDERDWVCPGCVARDEAEPMAAASEVAA